MFRGVPMLPAVAPPVDEKFHDCIPGPGDKPRFSWQGSMLTTPLKAYY